MTALNEYRARACETLLAAILACAAGMPAKQ